MIFSIVMPLLLIACLFFVPAWSEKGLAGGTRLVFSQDFWSRKYWYFHEPGAPRQPRPKLRNIALMAVVIPVGSLLFAVAFVYANQKLGWIGVIVVTIVLAPVFGRAVAWAKTSRMSGYQPSGSGEESADENAS